MTDLITKYNIPPSQYTVITRSNYEAIRQLAEDQDYDPIAERMKEVIIPFYQSVKFTIIETTIEAII